MRISSTRHVLWICYNNNTIVPFTHTPMQTGASSQYAFLYGPLCSEFKCDRSFILFLLLHTTKNFFNTQLGIITETQQLLGRCKMHYFFFLFGFSVGSGWPFVNANFFFISSKMLTSPCQIALSTPPDFIFLTFSPCCATSASRSTSVT